jgi:hypothetical protein
MVIASRLMSQGTIAVFLVSTERMAFAHHFPATTWVWHRLTSRPARLTFLLLGSALLLITVAFRIHAAIFEYIVTSVIEGLAKLSLDETTKSDVLTLVPALRPCPVVRQNLSRDQRRGGLGRVALNTIIASIQHEDSGGHERECAWSAHIYQGPAESRSELGRSIVTMVQPAESLLRKDPTSSYGTNPAVRCPLLKSEMRAILMMVTNILGEQPLQMAFTQRNNVVQQVSSATFDPPLGYTVLPGTPERGLRRAHFQGSNCRWKLTTIFRISIEDQKLGSGTKWKRLPQLLDDPTTRRMLGDVNVQDAPPIMADDEEAVEHAERDRWHREEIHGRNRFPMVSKEGQPALGRVRISRRSSSCHPLHSHFEFARLSRFAKYP